MTKRKLTADDIRQIREYCEYRDLSDEDLKLFIGQLIHDLELVDAENKNFQYNYTKACFDRDYYEDERDRLGAKVERLREQNRRFAGEIVLEMQSHGGCHFPKNFNQSNEEPCGKCIACEAQTALEE